MTSTHHEPTARAVRGMLGLVVFASLAAWIWTVSFEFVYDDHRFASGNGSLESVASAPWTAFDPATTSREGAEPGMWRPLRTLSFAVDHALFGAEAGGWHLSNVLLHALAAALVFGLGRALGLGLAGAGTAGLLFAFHPVQAESVAWVTSRGDLLCGVLLLTATLLHLRRVRMPWVGLCVAAAFLSKEAAVVAPLLLVVADLAAGGWQRARERRSVPLYATGILLLLVLCRSFVLSSAEVPTGQEGGLGLGVGGIAAALPSMFTWYAGRLFVPVSVPFDLQLEPGLALAAVFFGGLAVLASWHRLRLPRVGAAPLRIAAGWVLVALVPVTLFQFVFPLKILVAERFLYLAVAGPAIAVAFLLQRSGARVARAGLLVAPALLLLTVPATAAWRSDTALWGSVLEHDARHARAHYGMAWALESRPQKALKHYRSYLEQAPGDAGAWYRRGRMEEKLALLEPEGPGRRGRVQQATLSYANAVRLWDAGEREGRSRGVVDAHLRYALMIAATGKDREAMAAGAAAFIRWGKAGEAQRTASTEPLLRLQAWAKERNHGTFLQFLRGDRPDFSLEGTGRPPR